MSLLNLSDLTALIHGLPPGSEQAASMAVDRNNNLTKPAGSLGQLEELAIWLSAWQGQHPPRFDRPQIVIFAGNHGVTAKGVSAFPAEVTFQMVANFKAGGAAINQLAKIVGADFTIIELDLDTPTADISEHPAMTEAECISAFNTGWNSVDQSASMLVVGEMGIGNTTIASALAAALFDGQGADWAGPGTGVTGDALARKAAIVDHALKRHQHILSDPVGILQHLGGREIAAMAGAIVAARTHNIPVILDGFIATSAAAVLHKISASALDHCIAGHCSEEPGHIKMLQALGKQPLLSLGLRLGEGSGAALALNILQAAVATHTGMATFAEAGVSTSDE